MDNPVGKLCLFQFLIGRLGTLDTASWMTLQVDVSIPYRQARYLLSFLVLFYSFQFQFLIGRLGTITLQGHIKPKKHVSIPYRQARYFPGSTIFSLSLNCFNSLQVGQVPPFIISYSTSSPSFNSLQVGQVHDLYEVLDDIPYGFQFLIGRLGTYKMRYSCRFHCQFQFLIGRLGTVMNKI